MDALAEEKGPRYRRKKQALREFEEKTGVMLSNVFENGTPEDVAAIERQLGFVPTNVTSVASRSESGQESLEESSLHWSTTMEMKRIYYPCITLNENYQLSTCPVKMSP